MCVPGAPFSSHELRRTAPSAWLRSVRSALDDAPAPVGLFFRDDDAGWGTERLLELLDLFAALGLPVDLAVIPSALDAGLAAELRERARRDPVGLHQHGYAHADHEPERSGEATAGGEASGRDRKGSARGSGRRCEFGPSRAVARQRRDIAAGSRVLAGLLGPAVDPIFTPPWNRCTEATAACLAELGFAVLSREARAEPFGLPGLAELPVHLDWFAHRNGVRLAPAELAGRLAQAIRGGGPVGVMLHHAIMDAAEMRRAAELLALLAGHEAVAARPMRELATVAGHRPG